MSLSSWIPVIGTLSGTIVGFVASFGIAFFNRRAEESKAKSERDRVRIEKIFLLLFETKRDGGKLYFNAVDWIHRAKPIVITDSDEYPPLIELEMIVHLYYPELREQREDIVKSMQNLGAKYAEAQRTDCSNMTLEEKKEYSTEFFELRAVVDKKVEKMKISLAKIVKA